MDISKLAAFARSESYKPVAAAVALLSGAAVGVAVDRIFTAKSGPEAFEEAVEEPPSHVAVPEAETERVEIGVTFEKPDISELVDYTKFYRKSAKTEKEPGTEKEEPVNPSVFELITEDEFVSLTGNLDGYVTATGTYFPEERILAGWNDSMEPKDVATTIGNDAAIQFEDASVGAVYVRNTSLKVLYEVVRGYGLYEDES
jgi:hypothetical protein